MALGLGDLQKDWVEGPLNRFNPRINPLVGSGEPGASPVQPAFAPNQQFLNECLAIDSNGRAWWVDPHKRTIERA